MFKHIWVSFILFVLPAGFVFAGKVADQEIILDDSTKARKDSIAKLINTNSSIEESIGDDENTIG